MVRLEVTPPLLDVSRPDLGDLRVLTPQGEEVPYLIGPSVGSGEAVRDAADYKVNLSEKTTVIVVSTGTTSEIEAVVLVSPATEFLKSVGIEGRKDGGDWENISSDEVIFRQTGGAERMRVRVPAGVWRELRIKVDDERSHPVPFTGVRVATVAEKPETREQPLELGKRDELAGETHLLLDLGAGNLNATELALDVSDAVFSRRCSLGLSAATMGGGTRMDTISGGTIYRVVGDHGVSVEELVIPLHSRVPSRTLNLTICNGDSPPLLIKGAKVRYYPTVLEFHASLSGEWKLLAGNRDARAPQYDLGPLRATLAQAGGQRVAPGVLRANPNFVQPESLPGVEPSGAHINLENWSRRQAISAPTGVIRIELDAKTLAACRGDFGDIRLVQNGVQIPYLERPETVTLNLKPLSVTAVTDPKRPTVSRWEVTLPVDNLPALELTAKSSAPLFTRRFVVTTRRGDDFGNDWPVTLASADWTKSGTADVSLHLNLGGQRLPRKLLLETDHGDNPPIAIDELLVRYAAPSLAAKLVDSAPVYLYYGNPNAVRPQYDLQLVRNELLGSAPQAAATGEEEILKPDSREKRRVDAGSPWLWLALGSVVIVLLVIVARLLPKPAAE